MLLHSTAMHTHAHARSSDLRPAGLAVASLVVLAVVLKLTASVQRSAPLAAANRLGRPACCSHPSTHSAFSSPNS